MRRDAAIGSERGVCGIQVSWLKIFPRMSDMGTEYERKAADSRLDSKTYCMLFERSKTN